MSQENVEIVRRLWQTWNASDVQASIHLLDERAAAPGMPPSFLSRGHTEVAAMQGAPMGSRAIGRCSAVFTMRSRKSSKPLTARPSCSVQLHTGASVRHTDINADVAVGRPSWTIREGSVLRAHGYLTKGEALEAAGLQQSGRHSDYPLHL